jgi:PAS domain S-box-containing protein
MKAILLARHSIKTRTTLATLAIALACLWSLSYYTSRTLREDMERVLIEQQSSTATLLAAQVSGELEFRLKALERVAQEAAPVMSQGPAALQDFLEQRSILLELFNAGVLACDVAGTTLADAPPPAKRLGVNYLDVLVVASALREGRAGIGEPFIGKTLHSPVFGISVPIRATDGTVIGALSGVVNLGLPSFLDRITDNHYGRSGGYLLVDERNRTIVTASDKTRLMEKLPPPGVNAGIDHIISGRGDSGVLVNARGVEVMVSSRRIPFTGWAMVASLPTDEAFAPIRTMQQRMQIATLLLTLLATGAMALLLRRQLAPLQSAAAQLAGQTDARQALPIVRNDEIGVLIGAFNRLLATLWSREAELSASEARYRALFHDFIEESPYGLWMTDSHHRITFVNRAMPRVAGFGAESLVGRRVPDDFADAGIACILANYRAALDAGRPTPYECLVTLPSGATLWQGGWFTPLQDGDVFLGMLCSVEDISTRKETEERVNELYRNFVAFLESTRDFIYFKDIDSRIRFCSQALARFTGHRSWRDLIGKHDRDIFPPETAKLYEEEERQVFEKGKSLLDRIDPYRHNDGKEGWVSTNKWPLIDDQGRVVGLFGISTDITARRRTEAELEQHRHHLEELVASRTAELAQARDAAEAANRAKTTFLANMSHEIRTPMNAILGMVNILRRSGVSDEQAVRLNQIDAAAKHLLDVINDVLDIAKVEAGKLELQATALDIRGLLEQVRGVIADRAQNKGISVSIECAAFPGTLLGDPMRLLQALLNYATNAVKFSERGSITLRALVAHEDARTLVVRFEVADTGIGIDKSTLSRLFNAFEQADNSTTRKYGGTGLGLAITRRLAQLMGGDVGVDSTPGVGSTFWFTARLAKAPYPAAVPAAAATPDAAASAADAEQRLRREFAGTRVLLVDDEPVNLAVAQFMLEDVGFVVDSASDGAQAVARASRTAYALILMDMQMPVVDGLEATRRIRALAGGRHTPIIAMTANAYEDDRRRCLAAGMDGFLVKPFEPVALYATLLEQLLPSSA